MKIFIKDGVRFDEINQYAFVVFQAVYAVFQTFDREVVVTSAADGKHSERSYHYDNLAWDFRLYPSVKSRLIFRAVRKTLKKISSYYDVVYELTKDNEHLHIEYDQEREFSDAEKRKTALNDLLKTF